MNNDTNAINWFEIPVTDMARARHFYQVIFSIHLEESVMPGVEMAFFPYTPGNGKVSGALALSVHHIPSMEGAVIYFNGNPDLSSILDKVTTEGGVILMPKQLISDEIGYMAFFKDTEGNRIGLHSQH